MKAAVAAMLLLLALLHHAACHHQGHIWKHGDADHHAGGHHGRSSPSSPLAGLTQCVTVCGSGVTACMLDCYKPLIDLDPVELPVCLLECTNNAMACASACSVTGNNV